MRIIYKFLASVITITLCFPLNFALATNSVLDNSPSNFESFKSRINDSLVGFNCSSNNSIGFSANWSIPIEEKNQGRNSNIFTSGNSLESCGRVYSTFNFEYKGNTYEGKSWNVSSNLPDFAGFSTSAIIPNLPLWGTDAPSVGSWVGVVRYAPGLGFIWSESRVRAYNPKTLIFAIDPFVPLTEKNALVFNSKGDFIGIVSTMAIQKVNGLVTVHGAPLQCPLNKENPTITITNCSGGTKYAQDIWTESASIATPGSQITKRVCVVGTSTLGGNLQSLEQCSDNSFWVYTMCEIQPKVDLQLYSKKKWITSKTTKGLKDIEKCPEDKFSSNYLYYSFTGPLGGKYRLKSYGNVKFPTSYINLAITVKN